MTHVHEYILASVVMKQSPCQLCHSTVRQFRPSNRKYCIFMTFLADVFRDKTIAIGAHQQPFRSTSINLSRAFRLHSHNHSFWCTCESALATMKLGPCGRPLERPYNLRQLTD